MSRGEKSKKIPPLPALLFFCFPVTFHSMFVLTGFYQLQGCFDLLFLYSLRVRGENPKGSGRKFRSPLVLPRTLEDKENNISALLCIEPIIDRFSESLQSFLYVCFKLLVGVFRVAGFQPDTAGRFGTITAVFQFFSVYGAVIDRTSFTLGCVEHLSLALITAIAHFSKAITICTYGTAYIYIGHCNTSFPIDYIIFSEACLVNFRHFLTRVSSPALCSLNVAS